MFDLRAHLEATVGSHYVIGRELGGGGMARVFLATDSALERRIVIKVPLPELTVGVSVKRFEREIKLAAQLQHANIVPLLSAGDAAGIPYYTMPFIEGQSLRERLEAGGCPPFRETLTILRDVARALAYAHEHGVVHRDIKPENVLLSAGAAVVTDFGIAKALVNARLDRGGAPLSTVTQTGTAVGTPAYMAPEQIAGNPAIDHRADIYTFGCLAYELLTGRPPFEGRSVETLLSAHLVEQPVAIGARNLHCPPSLARTVMRCLEKDPDARPQSLKELLEILDTISGPASGFERFLHRLLPASRPLSASRTRRLWPALAVASATVTVAGALLLRNRPRAAPPQSEWVQLTDFIDGASAPALSADGRVLTFTRGPGAFMAEGQVYVQLLPDGEPLELTHDSLGKVDPAFSTDGSRIAYGVTEGFEWQIWQVPLIGGQPHLLLRNATGLRWGSPRQVMFSEIISGMHMGVVVSSESRSDLRRVYLPEKETWMAHRSYLSPDRKHVLIAEMDVATWMPCRVVPFDGSSRGERVGPPNGGCNAGAWAPDGKTIYLTANAGGRGFHIWRQSFPKGKPEQVTFGPTEEQGIAIAPDGRWLITSAGVSESSVWLHSAAGDRQLSSEGFAYEPALSSDGGRAYYIEALRSTTAASAPAERGSGYLHQPPGVLKAKTLGTGATETFFPDFPINGFAVSPDGRTIAMESVGDDGVSHVWVAPLDRSRPPRKISRRADAESLPLFLHHDELAFMACRAAGGQCRAYRQKLDGSDPILLFGGMEVSRLTDVSPDGEWAAVRMWAADPQASLPHVAINLDSGERLQLCDFCWPSWSRDGRYLLVRMATPGNVGSTWAIPIPSGRSLPVVPTGGWNLAELSRIPGVRKLVGLPGTSPSVETYVSTHETLRRNLYRIPLR